MGFLALDFETANESLASICQIGVVNFGLDNARDEFSTLIDPEDYFAGINISMHGIKPKDVVGAPTFPDVYPALAELLSERIVVSHTAFDRTALKRAISRYELPEIECQWLDSARVVRRTWTSCARAGYGLSSIAEQLGISYRHHDALEDARAAGKVLLRAIKESGIGIEDWLAQSLRSIGGPICREGNPAGAVYGEYIVFTGALQIPRREAAAMAARIGFTVSNSVSSHTSVLAIGDQDVSRRRPGESLSTKRRKAEALIALGCPIRIIGESDFLALYVSEKELERRVLAEAS
jgi:DNA polymerase-3 subunit epsilon